VRKHDGKSKLHTPRQRWKEDNIKMHLNKIVWENMDSSGSE
jgi:hypothetical protein